MTEHEILALLNGRRLLTDEIPFDIQEAKKLEFIKKEPGLNNHTCLRCGNKDKNKIGKHFCLRCNNICYYCKNCIMMGKISTCAELYSAPATISLEPSDKNYLNFDGEYTNEQKKASTKVIETIKQKSQLLIWAVCGAGKTEIIFPGINYALQKGLNICIATPRTDVVHELTPRLKKAFPEVQITSLFGGSENKYTNTPITISTTHQLLRFYKKFDVLILDEVDAFPYNYDKSLKYAVTNARKDNSTFIMLTATPPTSIKYNEQINKVIISKRYHGNPLPIPKLEWVGDWEKSLLTKNKVPKKLNDFINSSIGVGRKPMVFVPNLAIGNSLQDRIHDSKFVYSSHENRKTLVEQFKEGKIKCLITTTILERGVTIPLVDVAVLGADDEIFDEAALVQIAGRVGRKKEATSGRVNLFHNGKTNEMLKSIKHIKKMNRLGGFE
ncbi:MAG: helicase [Bacillales bacterium]|jgi:competence protein ComFA|nr:helicase [Bacillales bacterium]